MNLRNNTIDFAKFIAAFLVVAIHTSLFSDVNQTLYFVFNELVCRLAVPFFAICTGYYLCLSVNNGQFNKVWKQEWKLIKIYALWTFLYFLFLIPNWIEIDYLTFSNCIGYFKSALLTGSYFHLWYILYIIYSLPILYIIVKYVNFKYWIYIAILLYGLYALYYGYIEFMPKKVRQVLSLMKIGYAISLSQFITLPMLLCGAFVSKTKKWTLKNSYIGLVLSFILLMTEAIILKSWNHKSEFSYIIFILPVAYYLFKTLNKIKINKYRCQNLGNYSLIIYCIHPMFCKYINLIPTNTIMHFFIVCLLSVITSICWIQIRTNR